MTAEPEVLAVGALGFEREADQEQHAEGEEHTCRPGLGHLGGDAGEHRRTDECADRAGHAESHDYLPVDVAEAVVGDAGHERGADLGEVHRGGCHHRRDPGAHEQRARRDAVRHAERAVDDLRGEPDEGDDDQWWH